MFNTKLLYLFKNCCFVIHGALWTLALFGPIFGQGEGCYIRSYYYILLLDTLGAIAILAICGRTNDGQRAMTKAHPTFDRMS